MSELSTRQAARLRRAVFRIRLLIGSVAAGTSAVAVTVGTMLATDSPLTDLEQLAAAGLAGFIAYQLWLVGWSALLRRDPGVLRVPGLVGEPDPRRRGEPPNPAPLAGAAGRRSNDGRSFRSRSADLGDDRLDRDAESRRSS